MNYHVKINDKVYGPLSIAEVGKLYVGGYLAGTEEIKEVGQDDYVGLYDIWEIKNYLIDLLEKGYSEKDIHDETRQLVVKISDLKEKKIELKDKKQLKQSLEKFTKDKTFQEFQFDIPGVDSKKVSKAEISKENKPAKNNKTKNKKKTEDNIEKTKINTSFKELYPELEEESKNNDLIINESREVDIYNEQTSMIQMSQVPTIVEDDTSIIKQEIHINKPKKKKPSPIMFALILLVGVFLLTEDTKKVKGIKPISINIVFPQVFQSIDSNKADAFLKKGVKNYRDNISNNQFKSILFFINSVQNKMKNNPALDYLIRSYVEMGNISEDQKKNIKVIYDLIKIAEFNKKKTTHFYIGKAKLFQKIGKKNTAINVIENYLRLKSPSLEIYAIYLELLTEVGRFSESQKIYDKFKEKTTLPLNLYLAIYKYLTIEERYGDAKKILQTASKEHPGNIGLLLTYTELLFLEGDITKLGASLKLINKTNLRVTPYHYSIYLKYMGFYLAALNKHKLAIEYLKKSLRYYYSKDLVDKMSLVENIGDKQTNIFLEGIRAKKVYHSIEADLKDRNYKIAYFNIIKALNNYPKDMDLNLLLARIQRQQGHWDLAVGTMSKLFNLYPKNPKVIEKYVEMLILTYSFDKAIERINHYFKISKDPYKQNLLSGKYYFKKRQYQEAILAYKKAIDIYPLGVEALYDYSKLLFKLKKFELSQRELFKVIELDPNNIDYITLLSDIMYERDGVEVAIGYLKKNEEKFILSSKLQSKIAILYYRAGKLKEYENYKNNLLRNIADKDFYKFLIRTSILNDQEQEAIKHFRTISKLWPGDLGNKMQLGIYFYDNNRFKDSITVLNSITSNFSGYPKVNYYLSKNHYYLKKYELATKYAKREIEFNSKIEWGYIALGDIHVIKKEFFKAKTNYEKAIKINPISKGGLLGLAWIKFSQNKYPEAMELYNQAQKLDNNNPVIYRQKGYIYKSFGQTQLAKESFKTYLQLAPKARDYKIIKAEINSLQ